MGPITVKTSHLTRRLPYFAGVLESRWPQADGAGVVHHHARPLGQPPVLARIIGHEQEARAGFALAEATGPGELRPLRLAALYVLEEWHGQGLGRALLEHALGDAPAYLWVAEHNERAQRFAARLHAHHGRHRIARRAQMIQRVAFLQRAVDPFPRLLPDLGAPHLDAAGIEQGVVLVVLIFSKYFYLASLTSYYTFYLIESFGVSVVEAQICLFIFLGAMAAGTLAGGPIGDRLGRKTVIWFSILGTLPFTLALPHVGYATTIVLSVVIGFILASAFPAIIVYAQELVPGRIGAISGLFFGFAFGMGGIAAAFLGLVADWKGIDFVYQACAYLPALGLVTIFLPGEEARS